MNMSITPRLLLTISLLTGPLSLYAQIPAPAVRASVILRNNSSTAWERLLEIAQDQGASLQTRTAALHALRRFMANPQVREEVAALVAKDANMPIKVTGLRSLGWAAWDSDTRRFLADTASRDSNDPVKFEAIRSLGQARGDQDVYTYLVRKLDAGWSLPLKYALIKSLYFAAMDGHDDATATLQRATKDTNEPIKKAAIET
ncbi:MAG: hypothetical protein AABZ44_09670, partial [Elusimicrobiota bacterium]